MLDGVLAHAAEGERAEKSGGGAFAGDVTERDGQAALSVGKKIVEIVAQFAGGTIAGGQIESGNFARSARKKVARNLPRGGQLVVKTAFALPGLFVEARVFERDGHIGGERGEHAFVLGGERVGLRAFQVQNADQPVLHQKRNDEFRANRYTGFDFAAEKARILERVGDADGAALARGGAGESLVEGNAHARGDGVAIAHDEGAFEVLRFLIPQHDAENVIVNEFLDALRDATEELFAVEDRRDFAADFVEQRKRIGLLGIGREQTGRNGGGIAHQWEWRQFSSPIHGPGTLTFRPWSLDVCAAATLRE